MCDTFVAVGNATKDGSVIFAKNSDREPNEAHQIVIIPAADHPRGSQVTCTYRQIPQVEHTYAILLAKPFWIWGSEMGANEYGVTIGNEAVFTKIPVEKKGGLIGMDFIRLALERSQTAYDAMMWIIHLLEEYGQGGNCGFSHPFYYHNSFILADSQEAWVLETAGKFWAAEKVKSVRSISNGLTIGSDYDMASDHLVEFAIEKGWCKSKADFHFARCYSDKLYTTLSDSRKRQQDSQCQLEAIAGDITILDAMQILRSHNGRQKSFSPDFGLLGSDVCMHAGFGPVRGSQTTGSMVSKLNGAGTTHWLTGTASPCLSLFKPVWIDTGIPQEETPATGVFHEGNLFWRHELVHRKLVLNYPELSEGIHKDIAQIQYSWVQDFESQTNQSGGNRREMTVSCFQKDEEMRQKWIAQLSQLNYENKVSPFYSMAWMKLNRQAKMPEI